MLQAINLQYTRPSALPSRHRNNPNPHPKTQLTRKYVNLHFKEDELTFGHHKNKKSSSPSQREEMFYRTFHPKDTHKKHRSHHYYCRKTGRETAISQRSTIVGTPFASLEMGDQDVPAPIFPSLDKQRYKYLLNAVSGVNKLRRLPQFKTHSKTSNINQVEQAQTPKSVQKQVSSDQKQVGSPNIINLSVNFEQNHRNQFLQSQNSYQKMFKNKQLLLKGRYNSVRQNGSKQPSISLMMDDDFKVRQATFQQRRNKKRIIA